MFRIDPLARFSVVETGCWIWNGPIDDNGYGRQGKLLAHRLLFEITEGPICKGRELDHTCRVRACVNPDHLDPVTHAENVRRGIVGEVNRERQLSKTHCKRGHEFTPENTGRDHRGDRYCKKCQRVLRHGYYHGDIDSSRRKSRDKMRLRRSREKEETPNNV